jgi:hypothetical protein
MSCIDKAIRSAAVRVSLFVLLLPFISNFVFAGEAPKTPAGPAKQPDKPAEKAPEKPADPADKAPVMKLEEGGLLFAPSVAKNIRKYVPKNGDKYGVIFIGPGIAKADKAKLMPRSGGGWTFKSGPETLSETNATGIQMMENLPAALNSFKPGIVVIVGYAGRAKIEGTDKEDWTDAAQLCLRYGAIPIFAVPAADSEDDPLRWTFRNAAVSANVPAIDERVGSLSDRLPTLLKLIDQFVYGVSPAAKAKDAVDE